MFDLKNFEKLRSPNIEEKWTHKRNEMFCFKFLYLQRLESKCLLKMCTLHKGVYTLWRIVPTRNNYLLSKLINTQDQRTFLSAWCWLLRISAAGFWKFHHESQILPITEDLCFRESPVPRLKHAHNAVGELWGLTDNPLLKPLRRICWWINSLLFTCSEEIILSF